MYRNIDNSQNQFNLRYHKKWLNPGHTIEFRNERLLHDPD